MMIWCDVTTKEKDIEIIMFLSAKKSEMKKQIEKQIEKHKKNQKWTENFHTIKRF